MNIPSDPSISWISTILFLIGLFLFISGLNIIKIEKIFISHGFKTWFIGLLLMVFSIAIIYPKVISFGSELGYTSKKITTTDSRKDSIYFNQVSSWYHGHKDTRGILEHKDYKSAYNGLGVITSKPIIMSKGGEIELFIKADEDLINHKNTNWIEFINIGLHSETLLEKNNTLKYLLSNSGGVMFSLAPTSVKSELYKNKRKNNVIFMGSGYKKTLESKVYEVFHKPKEWNKITISVIDYNKINVYINNDLAINYVGDIPDEFYLSIGEDHTTLSYSIKNRIVINFSPKVIEINSEFK